MAFQVGDIKISGTIDDLSFYKSVFGWLVRRKGGPTRKQFKKSPAFARSRENSNEFTRCSQAASSMRKLIIKHTGIKHKTLYHRLIKLMRLLANTDKTSVRGQRDPLKGMHTMEGKLLLKDFEVTSGLSLCNLLISVDYFKETPRDKGSLPHNKAHAAPIKKRRMNPKVFRLSSTGVLKRSRDFLRNHTEKYGGNCGNRVS